MWLAPIERPPTLLGRIILRVGYVSWLIGQTALAIIVVLFTCGALYGLLDAFVF